MAHQTTQVTELSEQLEAELMKQYGPMLTGSALVAALGYPSCDAFRQAYARGTVPISVFPIEHRRGKYALSRDVARWLAALPPPPETHFMSSQGKGGLGQPGGVTM